MTCHTEAEGQAMVEILSKCQTWSLDSLHLFGDTGNAGVAIALMLFLP